MSEESVAMPDTSKNSRKERLVEVWEKTLAGEGVDLSNPGLIAVLNDNRLHIRAGAALLLGRRGEVSAIPHLNALLKDRSPLVRVEAAMSLCLLGDRSGVPVLIQVLDEDLLTGAPLTAARYLAALGHPRGYRVVLKALNSNLAGIRLAAAVALKDFLPYHDKESEGQQIDLLDTLSKALKDSDPLVRRELLYKVAMLDDSRASALLSRICRSDSDESVRQTAQQLLSARSGTKKAKRSRGKTL
jgi:HEAT repeat protein